MMEEKFSVDISTDSVESDDCDTDYIVTQNDIQNEKDDKNDEEEFDKLQNLKVYN